jgi:sugar phosphate isomerase/epimerase
VSEDGEIALLLQRFGIDAIDIAPAKYFPDLYNATARDIAAVKQMWADYGIEITGMQALLFGTVGLNVFAPQEIQNSFLSHMTAVFRIASELGAKRLVFGSPKNRDRSGLSNDETINIATKFFRTLGDIAKSYGVLVCLEPNPVCYGANFMTTSAETAQIVRNVDHPAIRMQLDSGALTVNGEAVDAVLNESAELIGHVHISEPQLRPIGDVGTNHNILRDAIRKFLPDHLLSIEMVATKEESHITSVARSIEFVLRHYCARLETQK